MKQIAYIGFGSNIEDKVEHCRKAVSSLLALDHHQRLAQSSFYKTRPLGYGEQDWFVNGVIQIETEWDPFRLLRSLKEVESRLGRKPTFRWGPRVVDLDLLFFGQERIATEELEVPHPRLHERHFVLVPLAEIDPHFIHPVFQKEIRDLLLSIREDQGVERL